MKKLYITLIVLLATLSLPAAVTVLSSDGYQSQVEFTLGDYSIWEMDSFVRITAPNMRSTNLPGAPELPFEEFKIALPPSGDIAWSLTILEEEQVTLNKRVRPVPHVSAQESGMSQYHHRVDESLYASSMGSYVTELEPDIFRGYIFTSLRVSPFRYDGQRGLRILKRAIISIKINGDVSYKSGAVPDDLTELFLDAVINPTQAKNWQQHFRSSINHAPFSKADYWLKIEVDKDGMYQLTRQNLSSLPLEDIDPRTIRMFTTGGAINSYNVGIAGPEFGEIPIKVIGEDDGHFDASDKIIFYGENRDRLDKTAELDILPKTVHNPYSRNGVYWLTFGGSFPSPPLRMQMHDLYSSYDSSMNSHKAVARYEKESHRIDPYSFEWYSDKLFGATTADYLFSLDLKDVEIDGANSINLTLRRDEMTGPDTTNNKIRVWVNERELPTGTHNYFFWHGGSYYSLTKNKATLREGENKIRIRVLREKSVDLFLDYIQIVYTQKLKKGAGQFIINGPDNLTNTNIAYQMQTGSSGVEIYRIGSLYDVKQVPWQEDADTFISPSNHKTKFVLTRASEYYSPVSVSQAAPKDLTLDTSQVDHIIISPAEFLEQAATLASMYQEFYDLSVRIVDQADIIDQFNGGHPDPFAIRQYLRYAYKNFTTPKLQGVTLLGTGTIDWRDKSRISAPKNKVMVYLRGSTSSDDYYVMMDSSTYPELTIGRYPVRNTAELNTMLSNYRNYVSNPTPGWWRNSMVFLADDLYNGSQPGAETYHTVDMEASANKMHKTVRINKVFAWEYDYDEFQNKPAARDDMLKSINEEGVLVWYYIGHGSYDSLGSEDYFNGATDMGRLRNTGKLPLFLPASCSVSNYDHWGYDSLGDKLVMLDNYGCIASVGATRRSGSEGNTRLMDLLFEEIIKKRHPLGKGIVAAKLHSNYNSNDLFYVLLGDPTLRINTPVRDSLVSVDGSPTSAVLRSRQQPHIEGSFEPFNGDGTASLRFYDSIRKYTLGSGYGVSQQGKQLFKGDVSVTNGNYQGGFIVPDDITNGDTGSIMCYLWDDASKQDYLSYFYPVNTRDNAVAVDNDGPPKIELFVGTMDFRDGDEVPTSTTLIAKISDGNGINVSGSFGHHIFLVIDDAAQPIPVTDYFNYNKDSFTEGTLRYPLPQLSEGPHTLQLIAFDSFNLPSVANTHFVAKRSSELSIQRLLPYPNPMKDEGHITFILSEEASLDIGIYTVTGKRVRRINTMGREGFNQIPIDARDNNGNRLANNTYFIKIKAKAASKSTEATERLVIYK